MNVLVVGLGVSGIACIKGLSKTGANIYAFDDSNEEKLRDRLKEQAYLNKGIKIVISDTRKPDDIKRQELCYDGGIVDFVKHLNQSKSLHLLLFLKIQVIQKLVIPY